MLIYCSSSLHMYVCTYGLKWVFPSLLLSSAVNPAIPKTHKTSADHFFPQIQFLVLAFIGIFISFSLMNLSKGKSVVHRQASTSRQSTAVYPGFCDSCELKRVDSHCFAQASAHISVSWLNVSMQHFLATFQRRSQRHRSTTIESFCRLVTQLVTPPHSLPTMLLTNKFIHIWTYLRKACM